MIEIPKPVKPGEEHAVTIDSVGTKGDGVARIQKFVIFVPGTVAGEKCKVRIIAVFEKFATSQKIEETQTDLEGKPARSNTTFP
ncbi:MAG TPA: TRAM domain-containing protein [Candidatus Norongarragalinales archaeon]|jgi:predicted RNA-binding protein with TRAM domain|nr:TRAM domain-containing protein [Candidatus Norongarragalinales archaeon]